MNNLILIILLETIFVAILTIMLVYKDYQRTENDEYINKILKSSEHLKLELLEMTAYSKALKRLNEIQERLLETNKK